MLDYRCISTLDQQQPLFSLLSSSSPNPIALPRHINFPGNRIIVIHRTTGKTLKKKKATHTHIHSISSRISHGRKCTCGTTTRRRCGGNGSAIERKGEPRERGRKRKRKRDREGSHRAPHSVRKRVSSP